MAPTTIRTVQTDRICQTDRRDSKSLEQALACHAFSSVHIHDDQDAVIRCYFRIREVHQVMVKTTKQQINAFVLKL